MEKEVITSSQQTVTNENTPQCDHTKACVGKNCCPIRRIIAAFKNGDVQFVMNIVAVLCIACVAFALFSQYVLGMQPCAWCVLQRFIFLCVAAICLLGNLFKTNLAKKTIATLSAFLCLLGSSAAWYQYSVASASFSCDMTFADKFMSKWTGLDALMPWLFGIYATCFDAKVTLLGIEYSLWGMVTFLFFSFILIIPVVNFRRKLQTTIY